MAASSADFTVHIVPHRPPAGKRRPALFWLCL